VEHLSLLRWRVKRERQLIPLWFSLAMTADALIVGAFLQAHGLGRVLAPLIGLAAAGAILHAVRGHR
jgi:hypothetical protein